MRFLFIGGINTLFGYSVYALLVFIGLHYSAAALLSTVAGVIFNFHTLGSIVFRNRKYSLFLKFIFVYVVTYLVNVSFIYILSNFGINAYISGAFVAVPVAFVGYFLNKKFVFCRRF